MCRTLARRGATRLAIEDPAFALHRTVVADAGLEPVPVPVDEGGLVVERLADSGATRSWSPPRTSSPTGVVLAPERRTALRRLGAGGTTRW